MGQLKEQLFLQHLNQSLVEVRNRFKLRYVAKKNDRFMAKGVTYEIGSCRAEGEEFVFEISSKIPQEMLPEKIRKERFFNEVFKLMKKGPKKPVGSRMENIVSATQEEELKERDYVNLTYRIREQELYTGEMVAKRLKQHQDKGTPIPVVPGVATIAGRLVMSLVEESIDTVVTKCVNDLIAANEKTIIALGGSFARSVRRPAAPRPAAKPEAKKAVAKKPAAKKPAAPKPAAKKPAAKKAVAKPVAKKPVAKKPVAKKPVAKKAVAKPAAKKVVAKKAVAKKPVAKKAVAKKATKKK